MDNHEWVKIEQAPDAVQAEVLRGLLEAQGFIVFVSREGYESAIGIVGYPSADIEILVPKYQAEEAKQTLRDYYEGKFNLDE
ncbi:MAG: DUF2007 domain-containing protein [Anaerolineales bacterium]|jgi:hypothetical protein